MVRCSLGLYRVIFFILYLEIILAAESGPYISTLVRAGKCKKPPTPYQKDLSIDVTVQMFNKNKRTYLRGNYTAYKPDPNLKLTLHDYNLMNGTWQQTFHISGMSCRGHIVNMLGQIFGIKFNKKTCSVAKGVYVFNNIDYDIVDHVFMMSRDYGRVLRQVVVTSKTETAVCLEFESVITAKS